MQRFKIWSKENPNSFYADSHGKFDCIDRPMRENVYRYLTEASSYRLLVAKRGTAVAKVWTRDMIETAAYARRKNYTFKLPG